VLLVVHLFCALFLFHAAEAFTQRLSFRHYDIRDGLAHRRVGCIHQDRKGYIWFGTWEGLSRFDGYRFTNYAMRDGLSKKTRLLKTIRAICGWLQMYSPTECCPFL